MDQEPAIAMTPSARGFLDECKTLLSRLRFPGGGKDKGPACKSTPTQNHAGGLDKQVDQGTEDEDASDTFDSPFAVHGVAAHTSQQPPLTHPANSKASAAIAPHGPQRQAISPAQSMPGDAALPLPHHLQQQHGLEGPHGLGLHPQASWGSPRSSYRVSEAGSEAQRLYWLAHSSHGYVVPGRRSTGSNASSAGGGGAAIPAGALPPSRRASRPTIVPRLDLAPISVPPPPAKRQAEDSQGAAGRAQQHRRYGAPSSAPPHASPQAEQQQQPASAAGAAVEYPLHEQVCDLEEEVAMYGGPRRWNPPNEGRWYIYPPVSSQEVQGIEALCVALAQPQRRHVEALWRMYTSARYSAELMAGRAARLCKEMTREVAEGREDLRDMHNRHTAHVHHLNKMILQLHEELADARHAAAEATAAAAHLQQQQHSQSLGACSSAASTPTKSHPQGRTPSQQQRRQRWPSGGSGGSGGGGAMSAKEAAELQGAVEALLSDNTALSVENSDLLNELDNMRRLYMEAHEESQELRAQLRDGDQRAARISHQNTGLQRHSALLADENEVLRSELSALRAIVGGMGLRLGPTSAKPTQLVQHTHTQAVGAPGTAAAAAVAPSATTPPPVPRSSGAGGRQVAAGQQQNSHAQLHQHAAPAPAGGRLPGGGGEQMPCAAFTAGLLAAQHTADGAVRVKVNEAAVANKEALRALQQHALQPQSRSSSQQSLQTPSS